MQECNPSAFQTEMKAGSFRASRSHGEEKKPSFPRKRKTHKKLDNSYD